MDTIQKQIRDAEKMDRWEHEEDDRVLEERVGRRGPHGFRPAPPEPREYEGLEKDRL